MTLVQLSEECRKRGVPVHHSALSRIERGTNAPRPELWRVLVEILGFDPNDAPIPHVASREGPGKILQPVSPEWLEEHYTVKGWTVSQIAQEIGRSTGYAWELLRNSGIRMRKSGYRQSSGEMRKARLAKGMKASTLAELCGVSESTVSRIERGVNGAYESLREDLARHLEISIDQIPKSSYKKKKPRRRK